MKRLVLLALVVMLFCLVDSTAKAGPPMSLMFDVGLWNNKPAIRIPIDWTNNMDIVAEDMTIYFKGNVVPYVKNGLFTNGIDIWAPQAQSGNYYTWYIGSTWITLNGNDWSTKWHWSVIRHK